MNLDEFKKIAKGIESYYPRMKTFDSPYTLELWYRELQDLTYEECLNAVRMHASKEKFPPSIAEIRENVVTMNSDGGTWSDGWEEVTRLIRKYGYAQEGKAMGEMTDKTREIVRRLGYQNICRSTTDELTAIRANFRMIYNEVESKRKDVARLPSDLRRITSNLLKEA